MLYSITLFVHSWLRWVVLIAVLWSIASSWSALRQGADWTPADERRRRILLRAVEVQVTLGLLLYVWLSPIVRGAFANMGAAMRSAPLRFFAIEHIVAMVIALGVLQMASARARKATEPRARHRIMLKGSAAFLVCVLAGIPWPGLKHARPLARTQLFEPSAAPQHDSELFQKRCASCHGAGGQGDGLAGSAMLPPPRNLADGAWQASVSDESIARVIREGGLSQNLSASMPPHPDLSEAQVTELVRYIRDLRDSKP